MKIRMIFSSKLRLAALLLTAGILAVSCAKDDTNDTIPGGNNVRFNLSEDTGWGEAAAQQTRSSESPHGSGVLTLNGENYADTLYIHTLISDGIESGPRGQSEGHTRAAPVTDMTAYGAFGVFGYLYSGAWDESQTPNFMYNIQIQQQGAVWGPSSTYYWPGGSKKLQFFAYAPYNGAGITLPASSAPGTPSFTYVVPDNVADQKDILVAKSSELAANYNNNAPLSFTHPLTAVKFVVGDDMVNSKVTKITLKNVLSSGRYIIGESSWTPAGQYKNFSQTLDMSPGTIPGTAITSHAQTFMMIPQTLPALAKIEIELTDLLSNQNWTLSASINQGVWPIGKTVTYKISTSSIDVQYTFDVSSSINFTYESGTSNEFSLQTSRTISGPGHAAVTQHVPAEITEYSTDGGTTWLPWTTGALPWFGIDNFQTVSPNPVVYPATAASIPAFHQSSQNDILRAAAPVTDYDLSTFGGTLSRSTANCYIVNGPGTYSLPLVYGNAIKDGATNQSAYTATVSGMNTLTTFVNHNGQPITGPYLPAADGATLIWQDGDELVTDVALNGDNLTFTVNQATIQQGNAVVAALSGNNILWSWHIWVTDYELGTGDENVTNITNKTYSMMPVNIGWCDPSTDVYAQRSVLIKVKQMYSGLEKICEINQNGASFGYSGNNPYFQWGRKDPMLPGVRINGNPTGVDKSFYTTGSTYAYKAVGGQATIAQSISFPYNLYASSLQWDWCSTSYDNLWNNAAPDNGPTMNDTPVIKTIYDPSPAGFALPPTNVYTGMTFDGENASNFSIINTPFNSPAQVTANSGWTFYCNTMSGVGVYDPSGGTYFMPNIGGREEGDLFDLGTQGYNWTGGVQYENIDNAIHTFTTSSVVSPSETHGRSYAFPVRPMRE